MFVEKVVEGLQGILSHFEWCVKRGVKQGCFLDR